MVDGLCGTVWIAIATLPKTYVGFKTVIIEFYPEAILKVNVVFDKVKPLHEQPDIYIRRFAAFQFKIAGPKRWSSAGLINKITLGGGGCIIGFVVPVGESQVDDKLSSTHIGML